MDKSLNQTAQAKRGSIVKGCIGFSCQLDCQFMGFVGGSSKPENKGVFCILQDRCSLTDCSLFIDRLIIDPENCFLLAFFHVGYAYPASCINFIYYVLFRLDLNIVAKESAACTYMIIFLHIRSPHTNSIASTGQVTIQPLQRILFFPKRRHSPTFWVLTIPFSMVRISLFMFLGAFPEPTP